MSVGDTAARMCCLPSLVVDRSQIVRDSQSFWSARKRQEFLFDTQQRSDTLFKLTPTNVG